MRMRRVFGVVAGGLVVIAACRGEPPSSQPGAQPPTMKAAAFVARPGAPLPPVPQLPAGWAWPFDAAALARGLTPLTVFRPINVAALQAHPATPCRPVEVAPNVWIAPLCTHLGIGRAVRALAPPSAPPRWFAPGAPSLPAGVDLRAMGLDGPMKHQQSAPVCWSFAISNVMENALRRAGRADVIAPLHLIAHDEWRAIRATASGHATTLETSWPYDPHKACELDHDVADSDSCETAYGIRRGSYREDPALVDELQRVDAAGGYRIASVHPLKDTPGDPDEVAATIATGQAVYAELEFNATAWNARSVSATGALADWEPDGTGGHAVTLVGYGTWDGRRSFLIHNSWGTSWGDGGYAWISAEMVRARLVDAWTVALVDASGRPLTPNGVTPPPPPPPPPPPSGHGRSECRLSGVVFGQAPVLPRSIPVGESICTASNAGGPSPGPWLQVCRRVSSGASNCALTVPGGTCVAAVFGGRSTAACCPLGVTNPADPRCVPADRLHPPRPGD